MEVLKRVARWLAVSTVGSALLLVGVALLFLPGPGLLLILAGLALLSVEFLWAQRLRERTVRRLGDVRRRASAGGGRAADPGRSRDNTDAA